MDARKSSRINHLFVTIRWVAEEELWLEATPRVFATYQRLWFPLTVRGELREHWGEPCLLDSMTLREVAGALSEKAFRGASYYRSILACACLHDDVNPVTQ